MIKIFYRLGNEIMLSRSQTEFATISKENVLWIDILEPTGEEKSKRKEPKKYLTRYSNI